MLSKEEFYSEVSIRKFNTVERSDSFLARVDSIRSGILNDNFYTDGVNNLIYRTSYGDEYIIDIMASFRPIRHINWVLAFPQTIMFRGSMVKSFVMMGRRLGDSGFRGHSFRKQL